MIISVPVGILQLLLFKAADTSAFTIQKNKHLFAKTSNLGASYDPSDPYSNVLDAYQKKKMTGVDIKLPSSLPSAEQVTVPVTVPVDDSITASLSIPDVASPVTVPVAVTDSIQDIVQAVNDAASSAIAASNQAIEAANSITVPATALGAKVTAAKVTAIAAATSAAFSVDSTSDKAPSLAEYFTKIGSTKSSMGILPLDTKEKLILLKNNLIPAAASTSSITPSGETITKASIGGAAAINLPTIDYNFDIDSVDWSHFVGSFQLEEYGAWYVTAFSLLFAINQREAGRQDAVKNFEEEIIAARGKADEAANAAVLAAEGAKQAKNLIMNIPKEEKVGDSMLDISKIRNLEVDNEIMNTEVYRLRKENTEQQNVISNLTRKTATLKELAPVKLEIPVGKSTMDRDPAEEKKILDILKDMDDENAKAQELAAVEAAKTVKKAKKTRTAKKAKKVVAAADTDTDATTVKAPVKKAAKTKAPKKAKKARAPRKAAKKPVEETVVAEKDPFFGKENVEPADEALKVIEAAEESFNEALAETTKEAAFIEELKSFVAKPEKGEVSAKKATKTKAPRKKKGAATAPTSDNANPWGALKESTLKRKTIAQLTAYLNERKVDVEGFSKAELVGTIQKL